MKIQVKKGKKNWYWRIIASNGEVLAHSETYSSKQMCMKTARMVSRTTKLSIMELVSTKSK